MQLDVGSEPYLSTAQALCLISHIFHYKSIANAALLLVNKLLVISFTDRQTDRQKVMYGI